MSTGDVARASEFVAPGRVEVDGDRRVESGIEGMADHIRGVRRVYPDLTMTVERQIVEREWEVTVYTARGTHREKWLGMKPTGEQLVVTGVNVDRVVQGLIVEHGSAANLLMPFLESGAVRAVAE